MRDEPPRDGRTPCVSYTRAGRNENVDAARGARLSRLDDACMSTIVNYENECKSRFMIEDNVCYARATRPAQGLRLGNMRARRRGGGKRYKLQELCVHSRCFQNRLEAVRGQNSRAQFLYMMNKAGLGMHLK